MHISTQLIEHVNIASAESGLSTQPEEKDKEEELDSSPSSAPSPGMDVEVEQIEKGVK